MDELFAVIYAISLDHGNAGLYVLGMTPIFTTAMDGVELPKPWRATEMKSYAKGRAPHRIWTKMVTNREAEKWNRAAERKKYEKINTLIRRIAKETRHTQKEIRAYLIAHANEIFR